MSNEPVKLRPGVRTYWSDDSKRLSLAECTHKALKATPNEPTMVRVQILVPSGQFLAATLGGGIGATSRDPHPALRTDAIDPGSAGTFTLVDAEGNGFSLQTADGHYVTAVDGGGLPADLSKADEPVQPIVTNGGEFHSGAVFHFIYVGPRSVQIQTADGLHYVTATNGGGIDSRRLAIATSATQIGKNERFSFFEIMLSAPHNGPPP